MTDFGGDFGLYLYGGAGLGLMGLWLVVDAIRRTRMEQEAKKIACSLRTLSMSVRFNDSSAGVADAIEGIAEEIEGEYATKH